MEQAETRIAVDDNVRASRSGPDRVGDLLRRRRAELGQDIATVSQYLRIRQSFLEAIEEGRLGALPGPTYAVGFVRSYAEYLGFDAAKIVAEFRDEVTVGKPQPMTWKSDPQRGQGSGGFGLILVILVLAALGAGWYFFGRQIFSQDVIEMVPEFLRPIESTASEGEASPEESEALDETAAADIDGDIEGQTPLLPVPEDLAPPSEADIPPADTEGSEGGAASVAPTTGANLPASVAGSTSTATSPTVPQAEESPTADATVTTGEAPTTEPSPAEPQAEEVASTEAADEPAADPAPQLAPKLVIRAKLESWVEITNSKKEVVLSRVLRAGETFSVPEEAGLIMTTGNAGGLELEVDGRKLPSLGTVGLVKRNIPLDPALLVSGETSGSGATTDSDPPSE